MKTDYRSIQDRKTGLEWLVGPDRKTFYSDAHRFCWFAKAGGHEDWRLPTMRELREIHTPGAGTKNLDPVFETRGDMVWAEGRGIFGFRYIRLVNGTKGWDTLGRRKHGFRVFAVRAWRKPPEGGS